MVKFTNVLASFIMTCLLAMMCAMPVVAAEQNLPDSFLIDDENGVSVGEEGDYFMYADNIMPGDVITRTLTVRNLQQGEAYALNMMSDPKYSTGPIDWLDNLYLQIIVDGQEVYAGRLRGDGKDTHTMKGNGVDMLSQGLDLGVYSPGDQNNLEFIVTADTHLSAQDFIEGSEAGIDWIFTAAKDAGTDGAGVDKTESPKTGVVMQYALYILLLLSLVLSIYFHIRGKHLKKEQDSILNG